MSAAVPFWDHDLLGPWDLSTKGWCALRSSLSRKADPWHFLWLLLESLGGSSKMGKPLHGNDFCRAEGVGSYSFCDVNKSWWRFSFAVLLAVHGIFNSPGWIPCGMLLLGCLHMGDSWDCTWEKEVRARWALLSEKQWNIIHMCCLWQIPREQGLRISTDWKPSVWISIVNFCC